MYTKRGVACAHRGRGLRGAGAGRSTFIMSAVKTMKALHKKLRSLLIVYVHFSVNHNRKNVILGGTRAGEQRELSRRETDGRNRFPRSFTA